MEDNGVHPDIVSYNALIQGLFGDGKLDFAMDIFHSILSKGLQPDVKIFTIFIGELIRRISGRGQSYVMEMEKMCSAPGSVTYSVLSKVVFKE